MNWSNDSEWHTLSNTEPKRFIESRTTLHWGCQVIDAAARAYVTPQPDDMHTNMSWSGEHFSGHPTSHDPARRVAVNLEQSAVEILDAANGETIGQLPLEPETLESTFQWIQRSLDPSGQSGHALKVPTYDLPPHPVQTGAQFGTPGPEAAELVRWFHNASMVLEQVRAQHEAASPVSAWPHHFDIATLIDLPDPKSGKAEGTRNINVGLSPGDGSYQLPYWYITPWPRPEDAVDPDRERPVLGGGGKWHLEGFLAAVLPAETLFQASDGASQYRQIQEFVTTGIEAAHKIIAEC